VNIAVTGGIGSGKSCVAAALAEQLGAMSVSADLLCRDLLEIGNPGYQQIRKDFSVDYFLPDGRIDRPALRKAIFSDSEQRARLDNILHPLVRKELVVRAAVAKTKGTDLVAEIPLLFEKGWQGDFDCSLVVFADPATCVTRIVQRDQVSKDEAMESIASQMPLVEKCKLGDWVIDNSGSFAATLTALRQFVRKIALNGLFQGKHEK
jgi:dephospho-CoA kinase